jgi:hypothetical protein
MLVPEPSIHHYALLPVSRRHYPDYEPGEDSLTQQEMRIDHLHPEILHPSALD